jgi:hypothetical protein
MDAGATTDAEPGPPEPRPSSLPPPPPPFAESGDATPEWIRPPKLVGQLSPGWRLAFGLGWAAVVAGTAAVWESSRVIGLSTWWLGPDAEPRLVLFQLLPFYGPLVVTIAAISNWRYAPYLGIASAVGAAAIGAGDLGRVRWIAVVELVLGAAALCISVAALAGMYRPAGNREPAPDRDPDDVR